jgi:adenylate cyclase
LLFAGLKTTVLRGLALHWMGGMAADLHRNITRGIRRRLAAVVFVDVVGYSRLMERDEVGTHERWMAMRSDIIEPLVGSHKGQVVKSTGDGLLLEFREALDAVNFALEVQRKFAFDPWHGESGSAMQLRISEHLGDIIPEKDDMFGDGVNVAARLLGYADPGGIVITAAIHDQVRHATSFNQVDLGFLTLRNIERRVRAYKIAAVELPAPTAMTVSAFQPSIAVLPLRPVGPRPPPRYLAEGIAHEIVACLASLRELFVVSSGSTVTLFESPLDNAGIAHQLGVRYLLTGTLNQLGDRLRGVVELSDTDTRSVLWTDRFQFTLEELFAFQEVIATKVSYALLPHIHIAELNRAARKPPDDVNAHDYLLQGMYRLYRLGEADFKAAHNLFKRAIQCDPEYAAAHAMMAKWYVLQVGEGRSGDVRADSHQALHYATRALQHSPSDPLGLSVFGHVQSFLFGEYDRAVDAFDRAIAGSPSFAIAWGLSAPTYCYMGEGAQAIERAQHALALSPLEPYAYFYRTALTLAHYINGAYLDSVLWGRKTLAAEPRLLANLRPLIASLVALERIDEARHLARDLMLLDPNFRVEQFCSWYPLKRKEHRVQLAQRLLAAGLPP